MAGFTKLVKAEGTPVVTVTIIEDGTTTDALAITEGVSLGGELTYNASAKGANMTFMFWTVNGVVRSDLAQNLTIKIPSKLELVAHFATNYTVAFLDTNTKLLGVNYISSTDSLTLPDAPSRVGANFLGYAPMHAYTDSPTPSPTNPGGKTFFVAKYEVSAAADKKVFVNGTQLENLYKINDVVTVSTSEANFSYWIDSNSGAILSYQSEFSLTVLNEDVHVTSIHEGQAVGPMVSIRRFFDYKEGYDSFIGHYELDETLYELIEVGFIHDDHAAKHIARNINPETNEFMVTSPDSSVKDNDYKMRAYMTYKVKETDEIVTVKNLSNYEIVFEVTAPAHTPANTEQFYIAGLDDNWDLSEVIPVIKDDDNKYYVTKSINAQPGTVFSHEYKYLHQPDFQYVENRDANRTIQYTLANDRVYVQKDTVDAWERLDVVVTIANKPETTGTDSIKLIGSMTSWQPDNAITFEEVNGVLQVTLVALDTSLMSSVNGFNEFKVYVDKGQTYWFDHQASSNMFDGWDNYQINNDHFTNGIELDIPHWTGLSLYAVNLKTGSQDTPISISGEFNDWNTTSHELTLLPGTELNTELGATNVYVYIGELTLTAGLKYKFVYKGNYEDGSDRITTSPYIFDVT